MLPYRCLSCRSIILFVYFTSDSLTVVQYCKFIPISKTMVLKYVKSSLSSLITLTGIFNIVDAKWLCFQACGRFINNNAVTKLANSSSKSPELLARYCDLLLKKRWADIVINKWTNWLWVYFNQACLHYCVAN